MCAPDGAGAPQTRAPTCIPHTHPLWCSAGVHYLPALMPPAAMRFAFGEAQTIIIPFGMMQKSFRAISHLYSTFEPKLSCTASPPAIYSQDMISDLLAKHDSTWHNEGVPGSGAGGDGCWDQGPGLQERAA